MRIDIVTLFPGMVEPALAESMMDGRGHTASLTSTW